MDKALNETRQSLQDAIDALDQATAELSPADRVVLLTQMLEMWSDFRERVSQRRSSAVFEVWQQQNGEPSMSEVARRAGVSRQVLSQIAAKEKARRREAELEDD